MTDAEFQIIAEQIDELENGMQEWDYRGDSATARLPWLHQIITDLMLEYRARRCRGAILRRGGLTN